MASPSALPLGPAYSPRKVFDRTGRQAGSRRARHPYSFQEDLQ